MIRRPPRSTLSSSSAASDVYKRQVVSVPTAAEDTAGDTEAVLVAEGRWWMLQWIRHRGRVLDGESCVVLTWLSDTSKVIMKPHALKRWGLCLSLDHSIHFHSMDFRADQWLLFNTRTSVSNGGRGLARTELFTEQGVLVATATQEALIRPPKESRL
eukprot:TRINITY_DN6232_c0_g2_i1.p1 TRINITY_DN6232_c0_g2~~TRINITY_DN6232_c0_g2_i1.p1  ORF type:complete len:157 (+),score=26.28 TRINITY_DN6232_c0_g2_i1:142-612(+)